MCHQEKIMQIFLLGKKTQIDETFCYMSLIQNYENYADL